MVSETCTSEPHGSTAAFHATGVLRRIGCAAPANLWVEGLLPEVAFLSKSRPMLSFVDTGPFRLGRTRSRSCRAHCRACSITVSMTKSGAATPIFW